MHRFMPYLIAGCTFILIAACAPLIPTELQATESTSIQPLPTLDPIFDSEGKPVIIQGTAAPPVPRLDPQMVARGEIVYGQFCASCHGAKLEGQPEWRSPLPDGSFPAPPHDATGHTWHHPDEVLLDIIANGSDPNLGGTMQGFGQIIDEQDRLAVLEYIKSSWGAEEREVQWWISAR